MTRRNLIIVVSALLILSGLFVLLYFFNANTATKRQRTRHVLGDSMATKVASYDINGEIFSYNGGVWIYTDEDTKKVVPINQNTFSQITDSFLALESGRVIDQDPSDEALKEYGLDEKTEIRAFNSDQETLFVFAFSIAPNAQETIYYQLSDTSPVYKTRNRYFSNSFKSEVDHWYDLRLLPFETNEDEVVEMRIPVTDHSDSMEEEHSDISSSGSFADSDSDHTHSHSDHTYHVVRLIREGQEWDGTGFSTVVDWTQSQLSTKKIQSYIRTVLNMKATSIDLGTFTPAMYKEYVEFTLRNGATLRYQLIEFADTHYVKMSGDAIVHDIAYVISDSNRDALMISEGQLLEEIPKE